MGESREVSTWWGGTSSKKLGVKASGGWGTYFESEEGRTYRLRLEVLSSDNWKRVARVVVVGWDR
jgi:hypothetical protein